MLCVFYNSIVSIGLNRKPSHTDRYVDLSSHHCKKQLTFKNASVIAKGGHRVPKTFEPWHTAMTNEADSNSMLLPRQYQLDSFKMATRN